MMVGVYVFVLYIQSNSPTLRPKFPEMGVMPLRHSTHTSRSAPRDCPDSLEPPHIGIANTVPIFGKRMHKYTKEFNYGK